MIVKKSLRLAGTYFVLGTVIFWLGALLLQGQFEQRSIEGFYSIIGANPSTWAYMNLGVLIGIILIAAGWYFINPAIETRNSLYWISMVVFSICLVVWLLEVNFRLDGITQKAVAFTREEQLVVPRIGVGLDPLVLVFIVGNLIATTLLTLSLGNTGLTPARFTSLVSIALIPVTAASLYYYVGFDFPEKIVGYQYLIGLLPLGIILIYQSFRNQTEGE